MNCRLCLEPGNERVRNGDQREVSNFVIELQLITTFEFSRKEICELFGGSAVGCFIGVILGLTILSSQAIAQWIKDLPNEYRNTILWSADHEEGDLTDWSFPSSQHAGGGIFNTVEQDVIADASSGQAHSGKFAARASISNAVRSHNGVRAVRLMRWTDKPWDVEGKEFPTEAYYSTWMYFPTTYNPNKYSPWDPGDGGWWNVFQFKALDDQDVSQPTWILNVGHDDVSNEMAFYLYSPIYSPASYPQKNKKAIPVGRWFHIEAYCRASLRSDGRITVWQDGLQILDVENVRTVLSPKHTNIVWGIGNYTDHIADGASEGKATIYFDDAIVSTRPVSFFVAAQIKAK